MTSKPTETVVRVWVRLMKAQQGALAAIERDLKAAALPPLAWYDVLWELERAGNVERRACVDDGRGQLIGITDRGRAIRRKMWPIYARAIQSAVGEHLSAAQADALDALLGRLIAANEDS